MSDPNPTNRSPLGMNANKLVIGKGTLSLMQTRSSRDKVSEKKRGSFLDGLLLKRVIKLDALKFYNWRPSLMPELARFMVIRTVSR